MHQRLIKVMILYLMLVSGCSSNEGVTPLMQAARSGNIQELEELIKTTKNIDRKSKYYWTALMFAAFEGHEDAVKILLDHGADPDRTSKYNQTALMFAASEGHKDVVKILLDHSANPNIISKYVPSPFETTAGLPPATALSESIRNHHLEIAVLLMDRGALVDIDSIALAGRSRDIDFLEKLKSKGANFNLPSTSEWYPTPLHSAAEIGDIIAIQWLLNNGADPNLVAYGKPALYKAVHNDKPEAVKLLLESGADVNFIYLDWTLLLHAVIKYTPESSYKDNYEVVKILVENGADIDYKIPHDNRSILDILRKNLSNYEEALKNKKETNSKSEYPMSIQHKKALIALFEKNSSAP